MSRLKALLKESLLYGVSSLLSRFLNFLLVPFYTHALSPADFGVSQIIFAAVAFCSILWQAGFDTAYLRLRHDESDEVGGRRLFSTAFFALCVTAGLGTALMAAATPWLGALLAIPEAQRDLLRWAAFILWLDALAVVPMAHLRFEHKALAFSLLRLFSVVVNIAGNVFFVWKGGFGLAGIFWANALASGLMLLPLVPLALRHLRVTVSGFLDRERLKGLLALGFPLVPAGLYGIVNDIAGRLSITWLLTDEDVAALYPGQGLTVLALTGLFAAAWKLGIFGLLLTQMYRLAWQPFFMQHGKDADAPALFGRILHLLLIGIGMSTGLVMLWLDKWVAYPIAGRSLIAPEYWGGLGMVPIILLAYAFQAVFIHFTLGLYLAKRTSYLLFSNGLGAAVTVAGNWLLVPRIGPLGACLAAVICYAVMAGMVMRQSQKLFRIELGGWWLGVLTIWLLGVHALGYQVQNHAADWSNALRLLTTAAVWVTGTILLVPWLGPWFGSWFKGSRRIFAAKPRA